MTVPLRNAGKYACSCGVVVLPAGGPAPAAGGGQHPEVPRGRAGRQVARGDGRVRHHPGRRLQHRLAPEAVRRWALCAAQHMQATLTQFHSTFA